jgi:outer membrane scaffolding protein for murein synthesis (MipA/OmpV family)
MRPTSLPITGRFARAMPRPRNLRLQAMGWVGVLMAAGAQAQADLQTPSQAPDKAPDQALTAPGAAAPADRTVQDNAHNAAPEPPTPDPIPAKRWQYTVGIKLKSSEQADGRKGLDLRPVLGLRYGRWRLGHATGDEWFKFSGYREATNLAYDLRDDDKLHIALSARIQNIEDNTSFDGFSSGKNTVRARVSMSYQLDKHWSLGSDVTQDLMNRGDGTTLSMGLSYLWPLSERSALSLSSGATWATARHWATQLRLRPVPEGGWQAGLGDWGWGMSYRYALTPQWAWFGTVGTARHLGQVNEVSPSHFSWNGQLGLLYFSR